ncbi:MAG: hypothetical protein K2X01_10425 [Cyanobacteria bacterium]|nr:hypothetical protein [Cyanobacteriota bacterium]
MMTISFLAQNYMFCPPMDDLVSYSSLLFKVAKPHPAKTVSTCFRLKQAA